VDARRAEPGSSRLDHASKTRFILKHETQRQATLRLAGGLGAYQTAELF
jgi:hypothetical protein